MCCGEVATKLLEQRPSDALLAAEIKHRRKACDGGDLDACFALARALRLGGKSVDDEFDAWKKGCAGSCFKFRAP